MAENQNFSHEAARRFTYLMNQIDELYHKVNVKSALSDSVSWILYCLFDMGGPCNQSEFTRLYGISRKTINSALSKLESLGLVKRTAGDGRNVIVSLTEQGLALAKKSVEPMISAENSVFDTWTQNEKSQFFRSWKIQVRPGKSVQGAGVDLSYGRLFGVLGKSLLLIFPHQVRK